MKKSLWGASLAALLSLPAPAFAQLKPPTAGIYAFSPGFGHRSQVCPSFYGEGFLTFNGPSGRTMDIRMPILGYPNSAYVSHQTLTIDERLGRQKISGTVEWVNGGINAPFLHSSGRFDADLVFVGTHSFAISVTEDFSDCHQEFISALVLVGH